MQNRGPETQSTYLSLLWGLVKAGTKLSYDSLTALKEPHLSDYKVKITNKDIIARLGLRHECMFPDCFEGESLQQELRTLKNQLKSEPDYDYDIVNKKLCYRIDKFLKYYEEYKDIMGPTTSCIRDAKRDKTLEKILNQVLYYSSFIWNVHSNRNEQPDDSQVDKIKGFISKNGNAYKILGLDTLAGRKTIKKAFDRLALNPNISSDELIRLDQARQILLDRKLRVIHDRQMMIKDKFKVSFQPSLPVVDLSHNSELNERDIKKEWEMRIAKLSR